MFDFKKSSTNNFMGKISTIIFIESQEIFVVGTTANDGRVNISPKEWILLEF